MKKPIYFILLVLPLVLSFSVHKYYLSVTDLAFNQDEQSIQMITRLFYDDLEAVLKERYDDTIIVDASEDQKKLDGYIAKYFKRKLQIRINDEPTSLRFVGKEYEDDYVVCYVEIPDITQVTSLEIENTLLMDIYPEQKNMVHTDVLGKKKSLLLVEGNAKALLNFSE